MSLEKLTNGVTEQVGSNTLEYAFDDAFSRTASFATRRFFLARM